MGTVFGGARVPPLGGVAIPEVGIGPARVGLAWTTGRSGGGARDGESDMHTTEFPNEAFQFRYSIAQTSGFVQGRVIPGRRLDQGAGPRGGAVWTHLSAGSSIS